MFSRKSYNVGIELLQSRGKKVKQTLSNLLWNRQLPRRTYREITIKCGLNIVADLPDTVVVTSAGNEGNLEGIIMENDPTIGAIQLNLMLAKTINNLLWNYGEITGYIFH